MGAIAEISGGSRSVLVIGRLLRAMLGAILVCLRRREPVAPGSGLA